MTIAKIDPLQALITAASKAAPITGEVARHRARADAASAPESARVVLADVSSSMADMAGASSKIAQELGMQLDEVIRLKQITGIAALFADRDFSPAWEPV